MPATDEYWAAKTGQEYASARQTERPKGKTRRSYDYLANGALTFRDPVDVLGHDQTLTPEKKFLWGLLKQTADDCRRVASSPRPHSREIKELREECLEWLTAPPAKYIGSLHVLCAHLNISPVKVQGHLLALLLGVGHQPEILWDENPNDKTKAKAA